MSATRTATQQDNTGKTPVPTFSPITQPYKITYKERIELTEVRCEGVIKGKNIKCNRILGKFSKGSVIEVECCGGQCKHKTLKKVA